MTDLGFAAPDRLLHGSEGSLVKVLSRFFPDSNHFGIA
jgi:hypothetical protein